jgi:cytoskeletal protein CcmA (bactofilin family)
MFRKAKSVTEDSRVQPLQRSAVTRPAAVMLHPSETISSIGSEMAVIGRITCKGALKIYGLVKGEVIASSAFIADGARIQGEIIAEELTIAGRVKGNIHALRVKLQATAVVEGDISHRSLSIDEHAWFEGRSAPENDPPEQPSNVNVESSTPQPSPEALVAFDDQCEFKADSTEEEPTWFRHTHAFLPACIAIISIGVVSYFALNALQQPRYTIDNVRIGIERSTELGSAEPLFRLESAAVRAPEVPQATPVVQNPSETIAPKAREASLDPEQATAARASTLETPQPAPIVQNPPETIAPKASEASLDPEQASALRASTPETPEAAPVAQNAPETIAPKAREASLDPEQATTFRASTPETLQAALVAQNAPETIAPKAREASLDPEQATALRASTPETLQAAPVAQNAPETTAPKAREAPLDAKMASEDAKVQAIEVEVLANVPVPRPRPTATPARKTMPVLQRSARAPMAPQWLRAVISPN